MYTLYVVITVITIVINVGIAIADLARAKFVLANSAEVGVPASWLPALGILKAAGGAGLLLGLLGIGPLGIAAAAGLVLFFIGAVGAHIRARVYYNLAVPGGYLVLAVASLLLAALTSPT
ncbi:MAG: DoxX family protein [Pseudonocardia sp.]|nr:DoxX family protein [Pseudonocardia sp.]